MPWASQPAILAEPVDEQVMVAVEAQASTARIAAVQAGAARNALHCETHDASAREHVAAVRAQTPSQVAALGGCCTGGATGGFLTHASSSTWRVSQLGVAGAPAGSHVTVAVARHDFNAESRSLHAEGTDAYCEMHCVSHCALDAEHIAVARCEQIDAQEVPLEPPPPAEGLHARLVASRRPKTNPW